MLFVVTVAGSAAILTRLLRLDGSHPGPVATVVFVAVLAIVSLARVARIRAVPDRRGLVVHNLVRTWRVEWAQVISVHFGERPWVQLDLSNGDVLAVMAIQRADGERALVQARRLAALVTAGDPDHRPSSPDGEQPGRAGGEER